MKRFILLLVLLGAISCGKKTSTSPAGGSSDPVPGLVQKLQVGDAADRKSALQALGDLGEQAKPALPSIHKAILDRDEGVAQAAVHAIQRIDPEGPATRYSNIRSNFVALGRAMDAYISAHDGAFPPTCTTVTTMVNDQPLKLPGLSWRVLLLPYLGEEALFREFDLNQPWDAEVNRKLIEKMPKVFAAPPGSPPSTQPGETHNQVFVSGDPFAFGPTIFPHPMTIFSRGNAQPQFKTENIPDGTSFTILIAEATQPVIWTKPDDLVFGAKIPKLGHCIDDVFHVCMADGSVRQFSRYCSSGDLRVAIMPADGVPLAIDDMILGPKTNPPEKTASMKGIVTYLGKPLVDAWIIFHDAKGREYPSRVGVDGSYSNPSVPIGPTTITVSLVDACEAFDYSNGKLKMKFKPQKFPAVYSNPKTSQLQFQVMEGTQTYHIDLNDRSD